MKAGLEHVVPLDDLLHYVDVRQISTDVQQQILELVRQAVREELARKADAPTGALRTREAAAYMGLRRTKPLRSAWGEPAPGCGKV